jgi:hypothetical protein
MPAKAFISYSHNDEKMLTALHKHHAVMKREKTISTWYDRDILAGGRVHGDIVDALTSSELFLALVSPDYVNSTYCYDKEFQQALSRNSAGTMQIVPIVIEPCDWISTPFAQFKALPKDGAAVSLWSNQNSAWLDVITELRRLIKVGTVTRSRASAAILSGAAPRNPRQSSSVRIKRDFDIIDRGEFRDRAFKAIRTHFKTNIRTVAAASNLLRAKFEDMGPTAFTCTLVNRGRSRGAESHITVHNEKSRGGMGDITYSFAPHDNSGSRNGWLSVDADEYEMHIKGTAGRREAFPGSSCASFVVGFL